MCPYKIVVCPIKIVVRPIKLVVCPYNIVVCPIQLVGVVGPVALGGHLRLRFVFTIEGVLLL